MIVYLDFDGTLVTHEFPAIGQLHPLAVNVIVKLNASGHEIVLNTMRVNFGTEHFRPALEYVNRIFGREFSHTSKKIEPPKWDLEQAVKDGILFLDDHAEDMPLMRFPNQKRKIVDWLAVYSELFEHKIIRR